jgi:hypothetical protein
MKWLSAIILALSLTACSTLSNVKPNALVVSSAIKVNQTSAPNDNFKCRNVSFVTTDRQGQNYSYMLTKGDSNIISGVKSVFPDYTRKYYIVADNDVTNQKVCNMYFDDNNIMYVQLNNGAIYKQKFDDDETN